MFRIITGLLKGGIVGAGVGYGAFRLGLGQGAMGYLVYAVIGFLAGVVCGKPLWRQETLWTPVVKGLVGAALSSLLYFGGQKLLGRVTAPLPASLGVQGLPLVQIPFVFGALVGIIYGVLVELDDGGSTAAAPATKGK
ncbi:MAG: hypothetical protein SF187_28345 [Deltaproteobacteria bacterium]|nr:hypothetical protein [Deltaproteobacteria bacterium]